jgi:HD-GYP domain-containing protein (c-di-GMP phosphodiesterase class II)
MSLQVFPLDAVRARVQLGQALPFSVRSADRTLLLAVGQVIHDDAQLEELFDRGAVVEAQELRALYGDDDPLFAPPVAKAPTAISMPAAQLPRRWDECACRVAAALAPDRSDRMPALDLAARNVLLLVERSDALAMSQTVRQLAGGQTHYGVSHAMNTGIACVTTARRLGWSVNEQQRALRAALTMNLSMVDLQGRLAHQVSPLTAKQRQAIDEHPVRSAEMLERDGVTDADWLAAVREHHETPDGKGYPHGLTTVGELGQLIRFADVYTALMSRRATRPAMSPREAGREIYEMTSGSPLCQTLIKAFGVYPPGSFVRLASDELGVVTRNGDKAYHPRVAALTTPLGQPRRAAVQRDTADERYRIVALLSESAMPLRVAGETLAAVIDDAE